MAVTREKLFEEIWAEPMTTVAARYNVSSTYLARICKRLKVPLPVRGHWTQSLSERASGVLFCPVARVRDELEWSKGHERTRYSQCSDGVRRLTLATSPRQRLAKLRDRSPHRSPSHHHVNPPTGPHIDKPKLRTCRTSVTQMRRGGRVVDCPRISNSSATSDSLAGGQLGGPGL